MVAVFREVSRWLLAAGVVFLGRMAAVFWQASRANTHDRRQQATWPRGFPSQTQQPPSADAAAVSCGQIGQIDEDLQVWCQALRLRDPDTYAHSERVADLAVALGRMLGLDETTLLHLRWGALLHDLGKVRIPNHILYKHGALTEEEWQIMRQHPIWGYDIVKSIPVLPEATLEVVRYHHERWDGRGYPDGLAGEDIPMLARILGVVDMWDAMTSTRPYHAPMSPRKVRRYLLQQAGSALDPNIVAAFIQMMDARFAPARPTPVRASQPRTRASAGALLATPRFPVDFVGSETLLWSPELQPRVPT